MSQTTGDDEPGTGARFVDRVARRLDRVFKPLVGGAQVSPQVDRPQASTPTWLCPDCGQPLSAHQLDDTERGRMYCPPPAD